MSIEASYFRVTPEKLARLNRDPKAAESFFGHDLDDPEALLRHWAQQEESGQHLAIGKDWHVLHFLLTGDAELKPHALPPPPLGNVVFGGTDTQWSCTYGKVRSLSPEEVRAVADALSRISVDELRSRFSVVSLNEAKIYPHGRRGQWTEEEARSVFETYPFIVEFFRAAAQAGDIVLLSSD